MSVLVRSLSDLYSTLQNTRYYFTQTLFPVSYVGY